MIFPFEDYKTISLLPGGLDFHNPKEYNGITLLLDAYQAISWAVVVLDSPKPLLFTGVVLAPGACSSPGVSQPCPSFYFTNTSC